MVLRWRLAGLLGLWRTGEAGEIALVTCAMLGPNLVGHAGPLLLELPDRIGPDQFRVDRRVFHSLADCQCLTLDCIRIAGGE